MRMRNKYRVSAPDERRWRGRTYDSKAEMEYARELAMRQEAGDIIEIVEQPGLWLGVPENKYRPDFLVIPPDAGPDAYEEPYYIDVKGMETPAFKRVKKLWASYGRLDLHIVKKKGRRFETVEIIEPHEGGSTNG